MKSIRPLFVLGFSLVALACSNGSTDAPSTTTAAQTSAAPAAPREVSRDAVVAASALLRMSAVLLEKGNSPEAAPFKEWVVNDPTDTFVQRNGDANTTFYFNANIAEGDAVFGTMQLVVEAHSIPEQGTTYTARIGDGKVPKSAKQLTGIDARVAAPIAGLARIAVYHPKDADLAQFAQFATFDVSLDTITVTELPHGDATFALEGGIIEDGDIIAGKATMTVTEKHDYTNPEAALVWFEAKSTREKL